MKIFASTDHVELARLNVAVQNRHVQLYPEYFTTYRFEGIAEEFKDFVSYEDFYFFIIEDDGENKGFIFFEIQNRPKTPFKKAYKCLYVHQISILEDSQGRGYGYKLMKRIEDFAIEENAACIELDYWIRNTQAKDFYKKLGFKGEREFVRKNIL
ncbi:GNAT family N-acetyltransferase [Oceanobacillus chungangensis]|uniref:GNAT family N-acetyltransferase n=1 Tax=Oceanobacillus chungangensis TaxID=1229152 RepID=A0A3D8PFY5_9BACI|nr:GNAT family N-acetyltransferase [Oceanobacillus chungangensis]RDW14990.1 GNAT family N-acetyltransferase [Oceanobacillus chungangensis]